MSRFLTGGSQCPTVMKQWRISTLTAVNQNSRPPDSYLFLFCERRYLVSRTNSTQPESSEKYSLQATSQDRLSPISQYLWHHIISARLLPRPIHQRTRPPLPVCCLLIKTRSSIRLRPKHLGIGGAHSLLLLLSRTVQPEFRVAFLSSSTLKAGSKVSAPTFSPN